MIGQLIGKGGQVDSGRFNGINQFLQHQVLYTEMSTASFGASEVVVLQWTRILTCAI
jgi:hypothetical protein